MNIAIISRKFIKIKKFRILFINGIVVFVFRISFANKKVNKNVDVSKKSTIAMGIALG